MTLTATWPCSPASKGALIQLAVNVTIFQIAGFVTLRIQRAAFATRVTAAVDRLRSIVRLP